MVITFHTDVLFRLIIYRYGQNVKSGVASRKYKFESDPTVNKFKIAVLVE